MANAAVVYTADFEYADPDDQPGVDRAGGCYVYSIESETTLKRTGSRSVKFETRSGDDNTACSGADYNIKYRSQYRFTDAGWVAGQTQYGPSSAVYVGFSVYIPTDYPAYTIAGADPKIILAQFNNGMGGPEWTFAIDDTGTVFHISRFWDAENLATAGGSEKMATVPVVKGKWLDCVVYRERALANNADGYVAVEKMWIDGVQVVNKSNGANAHDLEYRATQTGSTDTDLRFVIGHYDFHGYDYTGSAITFKVYFDAVTAALGQDNGYDLVVPGGAGTGSSIQVPEGFIAMYPSQPDSGASETYEEVDDAGDPAAWHAYVNTADYPFGPAEEHYIEGQNQSGSPGERFARFTTPSLSEGYITYSFFSKSSAEQSPAVPFEVQVDTGGGFTTVFSDTWNQSGSVSALRYTQRIYHAAGDVRIVFANTGLSNYVNLYLVSYKQEDASAASNIAATGTQASDKGTGTAVTLTPPTGFTTGEVLLVFIGTSADNYGGPEIVATGSLAGREVCTEVATGESDDYAFTGYVVPYAASITLSATLSESADWVIGARRHSSVNLTNTFDVRDASHQTDGSDASYHKRRSDTGGVVVSQALTTLNDNTYLVTASICNDKVGAAGCSGVATSNGSASAIIDEHSDTGNGPFLYVTGQNVAAAGANSADTHTYSGVNAAADGCTLRFSLQRAVSVSAGIDVPDSVDWDTPIADQSKSQAGSVFNIDPRSEFSGGTGSFVIAGFVYNSGTYTGCVPTLQPDGSVNIAITPGFSGTASFQMTVRDTTLPTPYSETCTVSFTVVNVAPVGANVTIRQVTGTTGYHRLDYNNNALWVRSDADDPIANLTVEITNAADTSGHLTASVESDGVTVKVIDDGSASLGDNTGIKFQYNDGSNNNALSPEYDLTVTVVAAVGTVTGTDATKTVQYEDEAVPIDILGNFTDSAGVPLDITKVNDIACADGDDPVSTTYGSIYNVGNVLYYTVDPALYSFGGTVTDTLVVTASNGTNTGTLTLTITINSKTIQGITGWDTWAQLG